MATQVSLLDGALASAGTLAIQTNGTTSAITISSAQVATFVNNPIMTGLTASRAVFTDGSKGLTSNAITGTGNVVMSASPTLTGTVAGASLQLSSLTSGRVTYAGSSGLLQDSANLLYSGTDLTVYGITVGRGAGAVSTNTAVGNSALSGNSTGAVNTGTGYNALGGNSAGVTGSNNTATGGYSLWAITSGANNSAFGQGALQSNTTASNNTAVGYQAGYSQVTGRITVIGYQSGYSNNGGEFTAAGFQSLYSNTTGTSNTAMGDYRALYSNTTGSNNSAFGNQALYSNTTASNNTAVGYQAGYNVTTGANNAFFGYVSGTDAVANITTTSNNIVMGNNSHTNAYIKVSWTVTSDARDKTSFAPIPLGLNFVCSLLPTAYQFRVSRDDETATGPVRYGFKAQDILAVEGDKPVIIDNNDLENLKYNQDSMIAVLVKAIQELKAEVDSLKSQLKGV
jgi:hypothetical protein